MTHNLKFIHNDVKTFLNPWTLILLNDSLNHFTCYLKYEIICNFKTVLTLICKRI